MKRNALTFFVHVIMSIILCVTLLLGNRVQVYATEPEGDSDPETSEISNENPSETMTESDESANPEVTDETVITDETVTTEESQPADTPATAEDSDSEEVSEMQDNTEVPEAVSENETEVPAEELPDNNNAVNSEESSSEEIAEEPEAGADISEIEETITEENEEAGENLNYSITHASIIVDPAFTQREFNGNDTIELKFIVRKYDSKDSGYVNVDVYDEYGSRIYNTYSSIKEFIVGRTNWTVFNNKTPFNIGTYTVKYYTSNDTGGSFTYRVTSLSGKCGQNVNYYLDENGKLTITGYGDMYNASSLSDSPFYDFRDTISEVFIGEGVTTVGENAFANCKNLKNVSLPSSLDTIEQTAFYECSKLSAIDIPEGVTTIRIMAFFNSGLKSVVIPASAMIIKYSAFAGTPVQSAWYNGTQAQWNSHINDRSFETSGNDSVFNKIVCGNGPMPKACPVYNGFCTSFGKSYWYEGGVKQGVYGDKKNVRDKEHNIERGREVCDMSPATKGWYWLDAVYDGAKAVNKEVYMPYIFQDEKTMSASKLEEWRQFANTYTEDPKGETAMMGDQLVAAVHAGTGKWVRYDGEGKMYKGWLTINNGLEFIYPDQAGYTYYYDYATGLMAKGWTTIGGRNYHFDEITGVLLN